MRHIETKRFGRISIREDSIITFPGGILDFEELNEFAVIGIEEYLPFLMLVSLGPVPLSFPVINPFPIFPSYQPALPPDVIDALDIRRKKEVQFYCFVSFGDGGRSFADLASPLVINASSLLGAHVHLKGDDYDSRAPIDLREILARALS